MHITCKNLLDLKSFQTIDLIAGIEGLDNIISWVYINQSESIKNWIYGGELVFITGMEIGYKNDTLYRLCSECIESAVSGIVILCNENYIDTIGPEIIDLSNISKVPLFKMPWELKLVDVTKDIANAIIMSQFNERSASRFFSELLFTDTLSLDYLTRISKKWDINIDSPSVIVTFRLIYSSLLDEPSKQKSTILLLQKYIINFLYSKNINPICSIACDEIYVYFNYSDECKLSGLSEQMKLFLAQSQEKIANVKIVGCVSKICNNVMDIRQYFSKSMHALNLAEKSRNDIEIYLFSGLGFLSLIVDNPDIKAIKQYCYETLKPVIEIDKLKKSDYLSTLKVFISANCNLITSAELLYIHRNTMVYRVDKLKNILNTDFNDMSIKIELANAIKLLEYFNFDVNTLPN
ncbi:MAG: hypothetical protein ATN34_01245 [Epulopiscium sp. Nele67-Bin002]|nr:MAG: hypothetical protein ATN34_01245 [Epulopiscium sp. Nele67-Bin002]OON92813.1 MAG: hypothetical protein ATN33_06490 [Epulopiscium sp. Nele67-Bin001]